MPPERPGGIELLLAYAGIPPGQTSSATAIIKLMRNLGGSIGVSLVTFSLARAAQVHHTQLADHVNPLDPAYQATMQQMSGAMGGDQAAHAAIAGIIQRQAGMLGYIDVFYLLSAITAVMALSVWIARRPENPVAVPVEAH